MVRLIRQFFSFFIGVIQLLCNYYVHFLFQRFLNIY